MEPTVSLEVDELASQFPPPAEFSVEELSVWFAAASAANVEPTVCIPHVAPDLGISAANNFAVRNLFLILCDGRRESLENLVCRIRKFVWDMRSTREDEELKKISELDDGDMERVVRLLCTRKRLLHKTMRESEENELNYFWDVCAYRSGPVPIPPTVREKLGENREIRDQLVRKIRIFEKIKKALDDGDEMGLEKSMEAMEDFNRRAARRLGRKKNKIAGQAKTSQIVDGLETGLTIEASPMRISSEERKQSANFLSSWLGKLKNEKISENENLCPKEIRSKSLDELLTAADDFDKFRSSREKVQNKLLELRMRPHFDRQNQNLSFAQVAALARQSTGDVSQGLRHVKIFLAGRWDRRPSMRLVLCPNSSYIPEALEGLDSDEDWEERWDGEDILDGEMNSIKSESQEEDLSFVVPDDSVPIEDEIDVPMKFLRSGRVMSSMTVTVIGPGNFVRQAESDNLISVIFCRPGFDSHLGRRPDESLLPPSPIRGGDRSTRDLRDAYHDSTTDDETKTAADCRAFVSLDVARQSLPTHSDDLLSTFVTPRPIRRSSAPGNLLGPTEVSQPANHRKRPTLEIDESKKRKKLTDYFLPQT